MVHDSRSDDPRSALDELTRLRAENARLGRELDEQRERFAHVMQNGLVGYLVSSFEENRFIDANRAFCDFIGMSRDELLATDPYQFWLDTTFSDDKDAEHRELQRVADGSVDDYRI
ncbi:MAG TPA: PAS domain-containing protein, partial [Polyangiaceae bacterium]|nr:PAS domain-containing protein [Polyangiaceae bacterium]